MVPGSRTILLPSFRSSSRFLQPLVIAAATHRMRLDGVVLKLPKFESNETKRFVNV